MGRRFGRPEEEERITMKSDLSIDLSQFSVPFLSETHFAKNSLLEWSVAALAFLAVMGVFRVAKTVVGRRLQKKRQTLTGMDLGPWIDVVHATGWSLYLAMGLTVSRIAVELPGKGEKILTGVISVLVGIQIARWAQAILGALLQTWALKEGDARSKTAAAGIRFIGRIAIWTVVVLLVLSNLGVELSAVVAGLGVGGVAAALAVQSILGDVFAGLFMYFDRPFDIGEFVIVGDVLGTVQTIGLRTTRINSLSGEKIILPNGDLAKRSIRNYGRMSERRIVFGVGIEYNLPAEKIELARNILEEAVKNQPDVRFDRAHFKGFGAYSLDYEIVYYVLSGDYNVYMDRQQAMNLEIYRRFEAEEIPFAFPTQTLHHIGPVLAEARPTPSDQPG